MLFFCFCLLGILEKYNACHSQNEEPANTRIGSTVTFDQEQVVDMPRISLSGDVQGVSPQPSSISQAEAVPPAATECFKDYFCECKEHENTCYDIKLKQTFVCSYGVVLTLNEKHLYDHMIYRNACRPRGMPPLKSCKVGESCKSQNLNEGQACLAEKEKISLCHCGTVVDFSTPEIRMTMEDGEGCEELFPCLSHQEVIFL
jgi:hypothetical protein